MFGQRTKADQFALAPSELGAAISNSAGGRKNLVLANLVAIRYYFHVATFYDATIRTCPGCAFTSAPGLRLSGLWLEKTLERQQVKDAESAPFAGSNGPLGATRPEPMPDPCQAMMPRWRFFGCK